MIQHSIIVLEKKSFVGLRTVDGVECDTYKETCRTLGLMEDDQLWRSVMEDASFQQLPKQMRALFIMIMMETELSDPKDLLETFHEAMSEDFQHKLLPPDNTDRVLLRTMLLIDLLERLQSAGREEKFKELGAVVTDEMRQRVAEALRQHARFHECREVREEINYDNEEMEQQLRIALHGEGTNHRGKLTVSQLAVYEAVKAAVQGNSPNTQIFIDARGGTGKTFLMNRLLYYVRTLDPDSIALAVAFTGIAAQLLQRGRTKNRVASLKPYERRTAQAFLDQGIESQYEWPLQNETKDDAMIRKHFNAAKLHRARNRHYENPDDQQLREQRQQAHVERQSQFRTPPDEQLSQERHEADAAIHRQFRNPPDEQLSQEHHAADAARDSERNLPGQTARAEETPVEARERMQRNFEERAATTT